MKKEVLSSLFPDEISDIIRNMSYSDSIVFNSKQYRKTAIIDYDGIKANNPDMVAYRDSDGNKGYTDVKTLVNLLSHESFTLYTNN